MPFASIDQSLFSQFSRRMFDGKGGVLLLLISLGSVIATALTYFGVVDKILLSSLFIWDAVLGGAILFLLGWRVFDVFRAHKKNIKEVSLNKKLGLLFAFTSLMPALFMAFFSLFLFHYGVQSWFSEQVKTAVIESNTIAKSYLAEHQNTIRADILAMASDLDRQHEVFVDNDVALKQMMNTQIFYRNLSEAVIINSIGDVIAFSGISSPDISWTHPYLSDEFSVGDVRILSEHEDDKVYAVATLNGFIGSMLLVGRPVDATVLDRVQKTRAASEQYTSLEARSDKIQQLLMMIYIVLSLVLVAVSIWFALYFSKRFTRPIDTLVDASNRVRAGDLDISLKESTGIAELDLLTQAYNKMTEQLSKQRHDLVSANRQLDERRIFIETVLGGVSSGILSIDHKNIIQLSNNMAGVILEQSGEELIKSSVLKIFPEIKKSLKNVQSNKSDNTTVVETELSYISENGTTRDLLVRIAPEMLNNKNIGAIITFDDITNLKTAQKNAAWSDVARRIAHEIKNPLTPIQLSADRLLKKFSPYIPKEDRETFDGCIETISTHVDDIGAMVSEFSSFARMPEAKLKKTDVKKILNQCVLIQQQGYKNLVIEQKGLLEGNDPVFLKIDAQLVRQAFINILQNAIDSINEKSKSGGLVHIWLYEYKDKIYISVLDSGKGFPNDRKIDVFLDPYVTVKKGGTGLGLAIVNKIMSDHLGKVLLGNMPWMAELKGLNDSIKDKALCGAIVSLIFPPFYTKDKGDDNE